MATTPTAQYPPGAVPLFRLLWGLDDLAMGHLLAELPADMRNEAMLIALADDGLIGFGQPGFDATRGEDYFVPRRFIGNAPVRPFLKKRSLKAPITTRR